MIKALQLAAKAAVRSWVKIGRITTVHGANDYDVQVNGHVDATGADVPMLHVRSLSSANHAVGDEVYLANINANRPREGALWVILDAGVKQFSVPLPAAVSAWSNAAGNNERQRANTASSVPVSLTVDALWTLNAILSNPRLLAVGSHVYAVASGSTTYRVSTTDASSSTLSTCALLVTEDFVIVADGGYVRRLSHDGTEAWSTAWPTTPIGVFPSLNPATPETLASYNSTTSTLVIATKAAGTSANGVALVGYNATTGAQVWSKYGTDIYPSDAEVPDDDTWLCHNTSTGELITRYALKGAQITRTATSGSESVTFRYGYEKDVHVRAFDELDGTVAWDVTLEEKGFAGDGQIYANGGAMEAFSKGATIDASGAYRFTFGACVVGVAEVAYTNPVSGLPVPNFKQTRTTYMASVTSSEASVLAIDTFTDWGHNVAFLQARLQYPRVLAFDPTQDSLVCFEPGAEAYTVPNGSTAYYTWDSSGNQVFGQVFASKPRHLIAIIGGAVTWALETTADDESIAVYGLPVAIGSNAGTVALPEAFPRLITFDTSTGAVSDSIEAAPLYRVVIVHGERIYASRSSYIDRY